MKILIVSGFLGAGKTTFIKELIRRTGLQPVVLENELGETDLDSREISSSAPAQTDILEFMEGCVCCTMKDSFANSLITISASLSPDYLVVEPSGVGRLGNILINAGKVCYEQIRLVKPVTVLVPASFPSNLSQYPGIYTDQIKNAGVIVYSKIEHEDPAVLEKVTEEIRRLNPDAQIVDRPYADQPDEWWMDLFAEETEKKEAPAVSLAAPDPMDQLTLRDVCFPSESDLVLFLEHMLFGYFGEIVRAKGNVKAGQQFLRFDLADSLYSIRGADESDSRQCVFIGKTVSRDRIYEKIPECAHRPGARKMMPAHAVGK